jgi:hypothetical protein
MELLNWLKKPLRWWIGIALIVLGTILVRGVDGCEYCVPFGASVIFLGLMAVLFFGKLK